MKSQTCSDRVTPVASSVCIFGAGQVHRADAFPFCVNPTGYDATPCHLLVIR